MVRISLVRREMLIILAIVLVDNHALELTRVFNQTMLFDFFLLFELFLHHEIRCRDVQYFLTEFFHATSPVECFEVLADVLQNIVSVAQLVHVLLLPHHVFELLQTRSHIAADQTHLS